MAKRRSGNKGLLKSFGRLIGFGVSLVFKILPIALSVAIVCFVFFGVRKMLYADPYFQVGRVTVSPSGVLTDQEYQSLQNQVAGRSLLRVNLLQISEDLRRNPKVKRAEVTRVLPNQLKVFLVTRLPMFQVRFSQNGPFFLIGNDRMVLSVLRAAAPEVLILEDFSARKKTYTVGTLYQNNYFDELTTLFEWIKTNPVLSTEPIAKMSIDSLGNVTLILNDGIEIRIGRQPGTSTDKTALLRTLLKTGERVNILYLDIRYQDVIVRKKTEK